ETVPNVMPQLLAFAVLRGFSLFGAARRGVPLQPAVTGAAAGLAAFSLSAALCLIVNGPIRMPYTGAVSGIIIVTLSALAGRRWLNWIALWKQQGDAAEIPTQEWTAL